MNGARRLPVPLAAAIGAGVLALALLPGAVAGREGRAPAPDLGTGAARLPAAPLVVALPALASGAEQMVPLLARLGLALPELDPSQLLIDLRLRYGLDPFDRSSLSALGIDPTGPCHVVDSGALVRPVLLLRLLPGGRDRFEQNAIARAAGREQLTARTARRVRGVDVVGWSASRTAPVRIAYAVDGERLAFAPSGCATGVDCVGEALRPRRLLAQDRAAQVVLAGLPDAALIAVAHQTALHEAPLIGARAGGERVSALALSLGVEREQARLTVRVLPTAAGRQQLAGYPALGGRAARLVQRRGALSLWFGVDAKGAAALALPLPYLASLRTALSAVGLDLDRELRAVADGGAALHVIDLEPRLPGLDEERSIDGALGAFFVEHGLEVPLLAFAGGEKTVSSLDRALGRRGGLLQLPGAASGTAAHLYAESGRVVGYALVDGELLVASGPGTLEQLAAERGPSETAAPGTFLALRGDAARARALLGRVGLFGAGDNRALRGVWAARQVASPLLGRLGALRLDLRRAGNLVEIEAQLELCGKVAPHRMAVEPAPP
ncbi:MAG: hypothetical protein JXR83_09560 [Deltaproteobacteria bacterium]|nr:hypothetical protein [Deltaproteobacteria bacterium]